MALILQVSLFLHISWFQCKAYEQRLNFQPFKFFHFHLYWSISEFSSSGSLFCLAEDGLNDLILIRWKQKGKEAKKEASKDRDVWQWRLQLMQWLACVVSRQSTGEANRASQQRCEDKTSIHPWFVAKQITSGWNGTEIHGSRIERVRHNFPVD